MASGVWLPVSCALFRVICVQLFLRSMNLAAVAGLVVLTTLYPGPCEALEAPDWPVISESLLQDDYECVDFPPDSDDKDIVHWSLDATVPSTGRNYTVHVGSLSSGLPKTFSFQLPDGGCGNRAKTSSTAVKRHCAYATNAGFFDTHNGRCVGNLIIDSAVQNLTSTNRSNFGLNGTHYVMGYFTNKTIADMKFLQLISGAGWLVRKGVSYIKTSMVGEGLREKFVTEKAPRTAVVVYRNGTLSLVQVDGEEDISAGLDLFEFSEILVKFGAWQAVNLDGGGSSVSVYNGDVVSKPTCIDISIICERSVSSIACMMNTD